MKVFALGLMVMLASACASRGASCDRRLAPINTSERAPQGRAAESTKRPEATDTDDAATGKGVP